MRIILLGYMVRGPLGGMAWHHLQYYLGLCQLGHDVYFFEDSDDYKSCYDPDVGKVGIDPTYGLEFAGSVFARFDSGERWAYFDAHTGTWHGPAGDRAYNLCATADIVVNLSGVNPMRPWLLSIPRRVFIDTDPVFTQVRHRTETDRWTLAQFHTDFFTFGANIGKPDCSIPRDDLPWIPTRQPIVLDVWDSSPGPQDAPFTTVMGWESYKSRDFEGNHYGMKSESLWAVRHLPRATSSGLEIAMGANPDAPISELRACGWTVKDAKEVTRSLETYSEYIRHSKGEFSVAKHGYVATRSGWFSERTANYLASGRPCVVEDTGFGAWIETGRGIVKYSTLEEAAHALDEVSHRYSFHCRAAREVAENYFDSRKVLTEMLDKISAT